jgi:hypothetical protein
MSLYTRSNRRAAANLAVSQAVNFYLDDKYLKERQHIIELSSRHDAESDKLLLGYYREAARLNPQFVYLFAQSVHLY